MKARDAVANFKLQQSRKREAERTMLVMRVLLKGHNYSTQLIISQHLIPASLQR